MAEQRFGPGRVVICGVRLYDMFGEHDKIEIECWCTGNEDYENC